jgi:hypothetical protein
VISLLVVMGHSDAVLMERAAASARGARRLAVGAPRGTAAGGGAGRTSAEADAVAALWLAAALDEDRAAMLH